MGIREKERIPNVLTIAGIDPSGGAGLIADVKAMSALGTYAAGVPTALTAQNTVGVSDVLPLPPDFVAEELKSVFSDLQIDAVKIGMLNDADVIGVVADALLQYKPRWIVVDPVMVAKSGDRLLRQDAVAALKEKLLPLASIITPNLPEAQELLGKSSPAETRIEMEADARRLIELYGSEWVLMKGGHLDSKDDALVAVDFLSGPRELWLESQRTSTKNTHGTGCTLSSAIAAQLALIGDMPEAVSSAKRYVAGAIEYADSLQVGRGHGPTHHFWNLWK